METKVRVQAALPTRVDLAGVAGLAGAVAEEGASRRLQERGFPTLREA